MSLNTTTLRSQITLDSPTGASGTSAPYPIATATFQSRAILMEDRKRLSVTINFAGGHTGILQVQGTDELGNCNGTANNPNVGMQPGSNTQTGALFWSQIPSGIVNVTNSTQTVLLSLTEVGTAWIRLAYNAATTSIPSLAVGSGTISAFITAKHT
jgi:hypothetical protein